MKESSIFKEVLKDSCDIPKSRVTVAPGEFVFKEGHPASMVFFHESGKIKLLKQSQQKAIVVSFSKPGMILGLTSVITSTIYQTSAVAMEESSGCFIAKKDFVEILNSSSNRLFFSVIDNLNDEISALQNRIVMMSNKSAKERFTEIVLMLAETFGLNELGELKLKTSVTELAELSGMSRETLHRLINHFFRAKKILEVKDKKVRILDFDKLLMIRKLGTA